MSYINPISAPYSQAGAVNRSAQNRRSSGSTGMPLERQDVDTLDAVEHHDEEHASDDPRKKKKKRESEGPPEETPDEGLDLRA